MRRHTAALAAAAATLLAAAPPAHAGDEDALALADRPAAPTEAPRDARLTAEFTAGQARLQPDGRRLDAHRMSLDARLDTRIAPRWRAVLADRLDWRWQDESPREAKVNTLKEAYLGLAASETRALDIGRVNLRLGVASGYNPTDFLREGALRSVVSPNPQSLRDNRLGSVMLRGQALWDGGAASALLAPRLARQRSDEPFSLDLGASNGDERVLLSWTQRLAPGLDPQLLLFRQAGRPLQAGLNLTALPERATVLYAEWAGGRSRSLLAEALGTTGDERFRQRWSVGGSYSGFGRATLTLERQFNEAALARGAWESLRGGPPLAYAAYRQLAQRRQDPPTRSAWFAMLAWPDAVPAWLDISAFVRRADADGSRQWWAELRHRGSGWDLSLQWQRQQGAPGTEYGLAPQRESAQLLLVLYF